MGLTISAGGSDILNAIRNGASSTYKDYVPLATDGDSVKEIGAIIMDFPALQNEFLNALVNRIGRVLLNSKLYTNPWSIFKKDMLEFGETVEEVFVELATPFEFDPAVAETELFKRQVPDVRAAFHPLNYKKFYKTTVQRETLRQAFLSENGLASLVTKIIDSLYSGAAYDEFEVMKYLLAKEILNNEMSSIDCSGMTTSSEIVKQIKAVSNKFTFMSEDYNITGVHTFSDKNDQFIIVNADFDASMNVDVLATAFNMDKAEFMGHKILVDSFGALDTARLDELFADQSTGNGGWYESLSEDSLNALDAIPAVLVDRSYFLIMDNMNAMKNQENEQGLYWNYFYHTWKTFSVSPFANAAVFVPDSVVY